MITIGYVDPNKFFEAYVGYTCHITRTDGGHIRLRATRPGVKGIEDLNENELMAFGSAIQRLSNAMKIALTTNGVAIRRVNVQINNNWSDLYHTEPSFCVHFYGRAYGAKIQPLGQALCFPSPREHKEFYEGNEPINSNDVELIRELLSSEQS